MSFEAIDTTLPLDIKPFATAESALAFMLGGNATLTLVSNKTQTRFTYKVSANRADSAMHFVSLLRGADNESDYSYLGRIAANGELYIGRKTPKAGDIGRDAPSALAFDYAYQWLTKRNAIPPLLEVWHEGRCGRCNRKLTVPRVLRADRLQSVSLKFSTDKRAVILTARLNY